MILASKEISRRNNLPVHLKCELWERDEHLTRWCVEHSGRVFHADTFEDAVEYIEKRKLTSAKKLEFIENIKQDLLQDIERKLKDLQHIEGIRNTPEYRGAKELFEVRNRLKDDLNMYSRDADSLIMLHYLKEMAENLYQLVQDMQDK